MYYGALTLGQETSLGEVKYEGEFFQSISPQIRPLGFESHVGVQGNPHHFSDSSGSIRSIWVDDEQDTHDLRVYGLSSGDFPDGSWSFVDLPSPINTADAESQPFFTGSRLFLNREVKIVYHDYWGPQTLSGYADPANWGQEVVVLGSGDLSIGGIFGVGEPSLAQREGKTLLYFAYVEARSAGSVPGRIDYDLGVGYVDISGLGPLPMTE